MKRILSGTMTSWNRIFCSLLVKDFPVTKTTRLWWHCIVCLNPHSSSFGSRLLSKSTARPFGGGHGLCGGDHEPLWGRSLHMTGGSRKGEGDPWFCSSVDDATVFKHMHGHVMWSCMFMISFCLCYRSGLVLKGASWSWLHNMSLIWHTGPPKPGPIFVPVDA